MCIVPKIYSRLVSYRPTKLGGFVSKARGTLPFHVTSIQRAYRAHLLRRATFAAVIQRAWRAHLVRRTPPTAAQRAAACARRQPAASRRLRLNMVSTFKSVPSADAR
jgi:2-hydroxychromene-2-carboxylate isomerase